MPINAAHVTVYTTEPEKARAQFKDIFNFPCVDAGHGWLIFALPPTELGVHPSDEPKGSNHQLAFACTDIHETIRELKSKGIIIKGQPETHSYGIVVMIELAGGLEILLYESRHASPLPNLNRR